MLTLASKLKRDDGLRGSRTSAAASDSTRRVSVRDRLLVKGNVRVRRPPASQRGLAGGFWDAEWPVAEQKYLLGNILQHNARCLRREDLALCAGRGNARGEKRVRSCGQTVPCRRGPCRCPAWRWGSRPREAGLWQGSVLAGGGGVLRVSCTPQHGGRSVQEGVRVR